MTSSASGPRSPGEVPGLLERLAGSAMEANHFARDYGITHHPAPDQAPPASRQTSPREQP
ncbi:hypothetical protein [Streptomyces europaeiscabiei]|uniref:hypothetical protein n=1 Tax=Streptomyces europaeiscabiei TaxID=146819 RepID=UPI0013C3E550|nr:hypothetical protein [Streptomyces europaeiscabiei]